MARCLFFSSVFWSLWLVVFLSALPDCLSGQKRNDPELRSPDFLDSLRRQIVVFRTKGDRGALASHLLEVSLQYSYNANSVDSVLQWQLEAKQIYRSLQDTSGLLRVNNALQHTYLLVDQPEMMGKALRENLQLSRVYQDTLQYIINQIGLGYFFQENTASGPIDSARYHFAEALKISTLFRDTLHMMIAHSELGRYYLTDDPNLAFAKKHLDQAMALLPYTDEQQAFVPFMQFTLGEYHAMAGQYREALSFFRRAIEAAQTFEDWALIAVTREKMASCYQELNDYSKAYQQIREVMRLQEIIRDQEQLETIQRMEAEYDLQRKNDQIALLQQEQELRQQRLQRQQQLTRLGIVFGLAVLLIAALTILVILQRLKANRQRAEQEEKLKQRLKDFYANVTHELYTPLTVIQGSARELPDQLPEKGRILRNTQQLVDWTDQLLMLSRAEAGMIEPHWINDDLFAFFRVVIEPFGYLAEQKGLDFSWSVGPQSTWYTDFDPDKIQQILANLLSNAIKFSRSGDSVTVRLNADQPNRQWTLIVQDTGPGIAPDQHDRIFERFYQEEQASYQGGAGIGLSVVREWVDLLGGTIALESKIGEGTTFRLTFPHRDQAPSETFINFLDKPDKGITREKDILDQHVPAGQESPLLLIIEDHADLVAVLRKSLSARYRVMAATTAEEGLDKAFSTIPDLVICDVMLDEMDGFAVMHALKKDYRTNHIPVIILTAKNTRADKLLGLQEGAEAYLTKPFDPDELDLRINKLIHQRQQLQLRWSASGHTEHREGSAKEQYLQQVHELLEARLSDESLSVADLCKATGMSRMQTHRKLKALTGFSPAQYIRHYRIEKAKYLLAKTQTQISEIAYQVGFRDPGYFSKQFRALTDMSPSQFRSKGFSKD